MIAVCLTVKPEEVLGRDGAGWLCCLYLVTGYLELTAPNQLLHKGRGLGNHFLLKLRLANGLHA